MQGRVDPAGLLGELTATVPATLVTAAADGFRTSVLPLIFDPTVGSNGALRGHLARPNEQWDVGGEGAAARAVSEVGTRAIAIVNGPDAYVSPAWYEEKARTGRVVPTWNYVVVVVHGTLTVHDDTDWLRHHVRELVDRHESGRPGPWSIDDAPRAYIDGQVRGIVGLELLIERIEAKRKLSQNRPPADVAGVIAALDTGTPMERAVAEAMWPASERVLHSRPHGGDREE